MIINLNLDAIGNALFILASMFFMHVVADFNLQGIMASMKQKTWWQKQEGYDEEDNGNDYKFLCFGIVFSGLFVLCFLCLLPMV